MHNDLGKNWWARQIVHNVVNEANSNICCNAEKKEMQEIIVERRQLQGRRKCDWQKTSWSGRKCVYHECSPLGYSSYTEDF